MSYSFAFFRETVACLRDRGMVWLHTSRLHSHLGGKVAGGVALVLPFGLVVG